MRILVAALLVTMVGPGLAADIAVTHGDTFRLDRTSGWTASMPPKLIRRALIKAARSGRAGSRRAID
jgi:hypothetical protein